MSRYVINAWPLWNISQLMNTLTECCFSSVLSEGSEELNLTSRAACCIRSLPQHIGLCTIRLHVCLTTCVHRSQRAERCSIFLAVIYIMCVGASPVMPYPTEDLLWAWCFYFQHVFLSICLRMHANCTCTNNHKARPTPTHIHTLQLFPFPSEEILIIILCVIMPVMPIHNGASAGCPAGVLPRAHIKAIIAWLAFRPSAFFVYMCLMIPREHPL